MGTETESWYQVASMAMLVVFTTLVSFGAFTTTRRYRRYRKRGENPPLLLVRDVIARNSLAAPFVAILVVRTLIAFGVDARWLGTNPIWVFGTGGVAVLGVLVYDLFEIFIEHDERTKEIQKKLDDAKAEEYDPYELPFGDA